MAGNERGLSRVAEKATETVRGLVNPMLLRIAHHGGYDIRRTILITGFHRSGTTWLAELLETIPATGIIFEPLDFRRVAGALRAGCTYQNFHPADDHWPEGEQFIGEVLRGRVLTAWTTSHLPIARAPRVDRWIVKMLNANAMLPWIAGRYSILPPVMIIRHPCAVFASWSRRGWPLLDHAPYRDSRFYDAYPEFGPVVDRLRTPEEYFAALWCLDHYAALQSLEAGGYQLCFYERLVADGAAEVARLLKRWGLPVPARLADAVVRPSAKASADLKPGSTAQLRGWRRYVGDAATDRMVNVLREFGIDFYGKDPEPDYSKAPGALTT